MDENPGRRVPMASWDDVAFENKFALSRTPIMLDNSMMIDALESILNLQAGSSILSHPSGTVTAAPWLGFGLRVDSVLQDTGAVKQAIPNISSSSDQLLGNEQYQSFQFAEAGNLVPQRSPEKENLTPLQEHLHTIYEMAGTSVQNEAVKCVRSQRERENTDLSTQLKLIAANYNGQLASGPSNRIEEIGGTAEGNYTGRFMSPQAMPKPSNATLGTSRPSEKRRVRARRGQATDQHSIAERQRRIRITDRMKELQQLVPNSHKTDKASMLDEIIQYVSLLQLRLKCACCSMRRSEGAGLEWRSGVAETNVRALLDKGDVQEALQVLGRQGVAVVPISVVKARSV